VTYAFTYRSNHADVVSAGTKPSLAAASERSGTVSPASLQRPAGTWPAAGRNSPDHGETSKLTGGRYALSRLGGHAISAASYGPRDVNAIQPAPRRPMPGDPGQVGIVGRSGPVGPRAAGPREPSWSAVYLARRRQRSRHSRLRSQPDGAQRTRWCRRSGPAVPGSDERPMPLSARARDFPAEPRPAWPVRSENRLLPAHFTLRSCIKKPMGGVLGKGIDHWSSNAAAGRRRGAARSRPFLTSPPRPGRDSRADTDPTWGQNGHIKNDLER